MLNIREQIKRFGSSTTALQLYQLLRFVAVLGLSLFAAWYFDDKKTVAIFELFLWLGAVFSSFWVSGFINTMIAAFPSAEDRGRLIHQSFWGLLQLGVVAAGGFLVLSFMYPSIVQSGLGSATMRAAVAGYLLFSGVVFLPEYYYFLNERKKELLWLGVINGVLLFLLPVAISLYLAKIDGLLYGMLLWIAGRVVFAYYVIRPVYRQFSTIESAVFIKAAFPLMLTFLVAGSADTIDGMVVREFFDDAGFTTFRYGSKEFPLFLILASSLSSAFVLKAANQLSDGLAYIRAVSKKYIYLFFTLAAIFLCISNEVYAIVLGEKYAGSVVIFDTLLLLVIPRLLFPQSILMAMKANKLLLVVSVIEMLLNMVLSVWLAAHYGLVGVAYATCIAFLSEKIILAAVLHIRLGIPFYRYTPLFPFLLGSFLIIGLYLYKFFH